MVHTESLFSHFNFETGLLFSAIETLIAIYTLLICHHYFYWPEQQAGNIRRHLAAGAEKANPPAANRATGVKWRCHATIVEIAIRVKVNNS
ncbi:TPA: hypothetical protein ACSP0D_004280 [Aeromonas veronii]